MSKSPKIRKGKIMAKTSEDTKKLLTCEQCGEMEEYYCHIEYSQGRRVCRRCKEANREADKRAYDNWVKYK